MRIDHEKPPLINFSGGFCHKNVGEKLLDFPDVGGLESFRTGDYIESNGFAFGEGFESITLNGGEVYEYIVTIVLFDKPETLGVIEPFHFTLCHFPYPLFMTPFRCRNCVNCCSCRSLEAGKPEYGRFPNAEKASETYCILFY
jgi:hypothetical protein